MWRDSGDRLACSTGPDIATVLCVSRGRQPGDCLGDTRQSLSPENTRSMNRKMLKLPRKMPAAIGTALAMPTRRRRLTSKIVKAEHHQAGSPVASCSCPRADATFRPKMQPNQPIMTTMAVPPMRLRPM